MGAHDSHVRDEAVERLEHEYHTDREGLILQLRALAGAIEHLADAVEDAAGGQGAGPSVRGHVDEARRSLKDIW